VSVSGKLEVGSAVLIMSSTPVVYDSATPVSPHRHLCNLMNSIILLTHVELVLYPGLFFIQNIQWWDEGVVSFVGTI
jgi:hypothetical protein